jgi:hypothetical protein
MLTLVRSPELSDFSKYETSEVRYRVFLSAVLIQADTNVRISALINNMSAGGVMATHTHFTELQGPLTILIRNFDPLPGTVAWNDGKKIGIAFENVIDLHKMLARRAELDALPALHSHNIVKRKRLLSVYTAPTITEVIHTGLSG